MSTFSATKLDLSEPDKFEMASVVTKNSRLGITSHKRLLVIKKGYLYYYSNVPKKFKGDASVVQTIHQLPKCSIEIVNIKQIKGYESNSSYFSIEFDAKNMLEREDIRKTMTLEEYNFSPKNVKENIVWQFTCDNQFIKQRWVAALQGLNNYYSKEKKDIEKFFNEHKDKNSEMNSSSSGGRNSQVPWRESQTGNRRTNDINYLQLVSSKSNDQATNKRSMSPDNRGQKPNYLNIADQSSSRLRGNSTNNEPEKKTEFMMNYSPVEPIQTEMSKPLILPTSQQSIETSKTTVQRNIQNSPINYLQLSDAKTSSPSKQQANNMLFSKTQKMKVSEETIQEQDTESNKSPGPTPIKINSPQNSSSYDVNEDEADQFEEQLITNEKDGLSKSHPQLPGQENDSIKKQLAQTQKVQNTGKGLFNNFVSSQSEKNLFKKDSKPILTSLVNIDLSDGDMIHGQKKQQSKNPTQSLKPQPQKIQFPQSPQKLSFYALHKYLYSSSLSFSQRIQLQHQFHNKLHKFCLQSSQIFTQYVESLSQENQSFDLSVIYRTNNSTILKHQSSGRLIKVGFVTSQNLTINGKEKIYFDEEAIKNLKRQFKVYNDLEKFLILIGVKNDPFCRLRVPLATLIEYKGVVALVVDQSYLEDEENIRTSNHVPNQDLKKNYPRQLQFLTNNGYETKDFTFVASAKEDALMITLLHEIVSNRITKEQLKKNYLKKILKIKRPEKNHNLEFNLPFTSELITKARQANASTSIQSLQEYIKTLDRIQEFKGICPKEQIIQILKICVFCKQIRKVYRAAQGQIEETHFLNLIFKQDPEMIKILNQSGYEQFPQIKGIVFNFISHYLGIKCQINEKAFKQQNQVNSKSNSKKIKKSDIILSTQIKAKLMMYDITKIELLQAYESMRKFISQQKLHLASEALKLLQNMHLSQSYTQISQNQLQLTYFKASLAYLQHDYLKCISYCKRYEQLLSNPINPKLFEIFLLMLKSYSHFSEDQFQVVFQKIIKLLEFNYGKDNSVFVSVYCITSYYFSQMARKMEPFSPKQQQLYAMSCKLLDQAEKMCLKFFGETSSQYIDILIDSAKLYQFRNQPLSQKYLDKARIIIISSNNNQKFIDYLLYQLKFLISTKQFDKCQIILHQCEQLIYLHKVKIESGKIISLMKSKFQMGIALINQKSYLAQQAIEQLWRSHKNQERATAVVLAAKLCKKLNLLNQDNQSSFAYSVQQNNKSFDVNSVGQTKQILINKVIDMIEAQSFAENQTLMSRLKQMLQENDFYVKKEMQTNGIKRLLIQIL